MSSQLHDREGPSRIRLLLVEDNPAHVAQVRRLLAASHRSAFQVSSCGLVEEALQMMQAGSYDVVLLDLSLPEGEGLETLARAKVAAATVPIVVMADDEDDTLAARSVRIGAQDYLVKGKWETALLARTLLNAIERHRVLCELRAAKAREHHLATHDALTGLLNRNGFEDHLARSLAQAKRSRGQLAILFLDVDRFKTINDTLGHPVGDVLLRTVAQRLAAQTRRSDVLARFGGDEFVLLLRDVRRDVDPATVAQKILQTFEEPFRLTDRDYWLTTSIGLALFPHDGDDGETLVRNADTAMYCAKSGGRNRYHFYTASMNAAVAEKLELATSLRTALEREELFLHYQPQIDVQAGTIVGAEALLRWRHPTRGLIEPSAFIPLAEEMGTILSLGDWVRQRACEDVARWERETGHKVRLALNASVRELESDGLEPSLARALWKSGLGPGRIELEITERAVIHEEAKIAETLGALRRLGVRTSIDDFGTGHSTLRALRALPVDALKIDRSFVAGLLSDPKDAAIVDAVLRMADVLGLTSVAEGIETREQMECLADLGCSLMQGDFFSKPVPAEEFHALLLAWDACGEAQSRLPEGPRRLVAGVGT